MSSEHDGIEAGPEVVDVRDGDVLDTALTEGVERAGAADHLDEVAMTRRIEGRSTILEEQVAVLGEPERDELREPERLGDVERRDVRAGLVGRLEARHQDDGDLHSQRIAESGGLAQLPRQEAAPVERLDGALYDPAEARGHPTGEHDLRHASGRERIEARGPRRRPLGRSRLRQRRHVVVARRLDLPSDDVGRRRQLSGRDPCPELLEARRVEPESLEDLVGLAIDAVEDHRARAS